MKNRDNLCEFCKAIGALFVMYVHIGSVIGKEILFLFTAQIFFVLSGLLSAKSKWYRSEPDPVGFIRQKAKSLLIPYYIWGLADLTVYLIFSPKSSELPQQLLCYLLGMRRITGDLCFTGAIWFITALFSAQVIFYILLKCIRSRYLQIFSGILILALAIIFKNSKVVLPFNLDTVPYILPTIAVGYYFSVSGLYDKYREQKARIWLIPLVLAILAFCYKGLGQMSDIFYRDFNNIFLFWFCGLIGVLAVFEMAKLLLMINIPILQKYLHFVGSSSMEFMAVHQQMVIHPLNLAGFIISNRFINIPVKYPVVLLLSSALVYLAVFLKKKIHNISKKA